jgi:hypothetical protein
MCIMHKLYGVQRMSAKTVSAKNSGHQQYSPLQSNGVGLWLIAGPRDITQKT